MINPTHAQLHRLRETISQAERDQQVKLDEQDAAVRDEKVSVEAERLIRLAANLNVGGVSPTSEPSSVSDFDSEN